VLCERKTVCWWCFWLRVYLTNTRISFLLNNFTLVLQSKEWCWQLYVSTSNCLSVE
jgi:hypothetical protein